jgi:hypothetical protein
MWLLSNAQLFDEPRVSIAIFNFQIIKKAPALTDQFEKTASGRMIFLVDLEVFGEIVNSTGKKRDLHFRGTRVPLMDRELLNHFLFM